MTKSSDEATTPGGDGAPGETLWRNADFMRLWGGETLSQIGSQVTMMALPLTAILMLDAGPQQVGLLAAAQYAGIPLVSLFAGVWLDTHRRRPALVVTNFGRAALLGLIPLMYVLDLLTMTLLLVVAFAVGVLTAVFDIAYVAYLPQLVSRQKVVEANAKLEATYSIADVGGPGLGGLLVQLLTAPLALLADVASYLTAGVLALRIRHTEVPAASSGPAPRPWESIRQGLSATLRHAVLRPMVVQSALFNLFGQAVFTLFLLYGVRNLHLSSTVLGAVLATGSLGGLAGTVVARKAAERFGTGRTIVWAMALASAALALVPAATGTPGTVLALLVVGLALHGVGLAVFNVHSLAVRATLVPGEMLGRVTATYRVISNGTLPLAGVLAGILGQAYGARAAMVICIVTLCGCSAVFLLSPVRRLDS